MPHNYLVLHSIDIYNQVQLHVCGSAQAGHLSQSCDPSALKHEARVPCDRLVRNADRVQFGR